MVELSDSCTPKALHFLGQFNKPFIRNGQHTAGMQGTICLADHRYFCCCFRVGGFVNVNKIVFAQYGIMRQKFYFRTFRFYLLKLVAALALTVCHFV